MSSRKLKEAINKGKIFAGAVIPMTQGERFLTIDMLRIIKQLEADKNRITVSNLGELHQVVEINNNQLILSWVLAPSTQGSITDKEIDFDQAIIQEIQEKIEAATKISLSAIDLGNQIASDSSIKKVTATEVINLLQAAQEPKIVSNVAARANGPQTDLFFTNDIRKLGGINDAQKEFTNTNVHQIEDCKVVRWSNERDVVVTTAAVPDNAQLAALHNKSKITIRSAPSSIESKILRCAAFSRSSLNIEVCIGFDIKKRKEVIHLSKILNQAEVISLARELLDELDSYQ